MNLTTHMLLAFTLQISEYLLSIVKW